MSRMQGKVAVVTGAASGIGRATARQLIDEGAIVIGADVNQAQLRELETSLGESFKMVAGT